MKKRKKEKKTERREVCEILLLRKPGTLTGPSWLYFCNLDMFFCHGCGLYAAVSHCGAPYF